MAQVIVEINTRYGIEFLMDSKEAASLIDLLAKTTPVRNKYEKDIYIKEAPVTVLVRTLPPMNLMSEKQYDTLKEAEREVSEEQVIPE